MDTNAIYGLGLLLGIIVIYFLPSIVAGRRNHKNTNAITVLNLFLGWTLLGWVIALVWAFTDNVVEEEKAATYEPKLQNQPTRDE